jgi:chromate transporter
MNQVALLPTIRLVWTFFKIGATAFGGLGASLAVMHREFVDRQKVLTAEQMSEALAFTKPLPGSTVVQVVAYLGYRFGGWHGSAIATIAFLTPPMLAMLLMASAYGVVHEFPGFTSGVNGLVASVAGLMAATTWKLGRASVKGLLPLAIAGSAFVASVTFEANAAIIVAVAGVLGMLIHRSK